MLANLTPILQHKVLKQYPQVMSPRDLPPAGSDGCLALVGCLLPPNMRRRSRREPRALRVARRPPLFAFYNLCPTLHLALYSLLCFSRYSSTPPLPHSSTLLLFYSSTLLLFRASTPQLLYSSILLPRFSSTLLLSYSPTPLFVQSSTFLFFHSSAALY